MAEMTTGRRERKKAATRQALADAALDLFLEHGYDQVSVRDIADAADVSTTTLFKHFPSKEALVFDEDTGQEELLVAAVRGRAPGKSIPRALREHIHRTVASTGEPGARFTAFMELVNTTPALTDYAHRMWTRHQDTLARAIAEDTGLPADDPSCAALAHFALEVPALSRRAGAVDAAFDLLERGWDRVQTGNGPS